MKYESYLKRKLPADGSDKTLGSNVLSPIDFHVAVSALTKNNFRGCWCIAATTVPLVKNAHTTHGSVRTLHSDETKLGRTICETRKMDFLFMPL